MKNFAAKRPFLFTLLVMGILQIMVLGGLLLANLLDLSLIALDLPLMVINCLVAVLLLSALGWWKSAGFNRFSEWKNLHLLILPVLLLVGPTLFLQLQLPEAGRILPLLIITLLIGFQEEAIFRGILLRALQPRGLVLAVLISAFLFGIIHANSLLVGRDGMFVLTQIVASFLGAIGLGAIRLRINTVWPLVFLHALNDFLQFSATGGLEAGQVDTNLLWLKLGVSGLMALYGLYLLRGEYGRLKVAPV